MNPADEQLLEQARQGESDCFELLVKRYRNNLLRFIAARVPTVQDAEDIVQETFLKAYNNMHRFDSRYAFKTWLFTIACNCSSSYMRKKKPLPAELPETETIELSPAERALDAEQSDHLWKTAATLSADQYTALWLRYKEQMSTKSVARAMNISAVHARVLLHRARSALSKTLTR